jgi:hypothetical protein
MKRVGYFFLLCGLLTSTVWGQSLTTNKPSRVVRSVGFYFSSPSVTRKAQPEVKLGTFTSFPARVLNISPRLVHLASDMKEKMETRLVSSTVFASPAVIVLR